MQVAIFGEKLKTTGITLPEESGAFDEVSFHAIPNGIGINLHIDKNKFFSSDLYPDGRSNDLLLGLTKTPEPVLTDRIEEAAPIHWSPSEVPPATLTTVSIDEKALPNSNYQKIKKKMAFDVVVLDPGHGGHDTGAIGYNNIYEKNIVLQIAKKVGGYIKENMPDVKVVYTRKTDKFIELQERGSIANRHKGDLFVSIHCNAARSSQAYGSEIYFLGLERSQTALEVMKRENKVVLPNSNVKQKKLSQKDLLIYELANSGYINTSQYIAGMMEHQFDDRAQRHSRGVKQARFVVLYHASMPAVLVETGFITNPNEAQYLSSDYGQSIIASAIFRAIRNYKEEYENENAEHLTSK